MPDSPPIVAASVRQPLSEVLIAFGEARIRSAMRELTLVERTKLLRILLDAVYPGDISSMQAILARYAASTFDMVGRLPSKVGARILAELEVPELLQARLVSKTWASLYATWPLDLLFLELILPSLRCSQDRHPGSGNLAGQSSRHH